MIDSDDEALSVEDLLAMNKTILRQLRIVADGLHQLSEQSVVLPDEILTALHVIADTVGVTTDAVLAKE